MRARAMNPRPTTPPIRFRTSAYVFLEGERESSWLSRLAGAEVPVALLWGVSLLGLLAVVILVPHAEREAVVALVAAEVAAVVATVVLSAVWVRGQRTPVVEGEALVLEGVLDEVRIPFAEIARVEIAALAGGDAPRSRLSLVRREGSRARLDLPREEALLLCRTLQGRLFGGGPGSPYDVALRSLDRGSEAVPAWVSRLRERFGQSGYRRAGSIANDELDRALHDAALPASRRLGAALAICAIGGAEGAEGLRRVAARLETATLRIAVERVAEGTLDEEALAAAEAEDAVLGRAGGQGTGAS